MDSGFNEFPRERTEFSDLAYAALGRALAYATAFEAVCRSLSSLEEVRHAMDLAKESEQDSDAVFGVAIEAVWGKRLYEHVGRIIENQHLPDDVASTIKRAKGARNEIAHQITLGISQYIESESGRSKFLVRLSELTSEIAHGFLLVELISILETNELNPVPSSLANYADQVAEWVTDV